MTVTKTRSRRFTACHRHPSEPVTGFCSLCLRDRLAGLDSSSSGQIDTQKTVVCSRRTRGHGVAPAPVPELCRSKSVVDKKRDLITDLRRKSCDVRARNSLSDLFVRNDEIRDEIRGGIRVESMNLGFSSIVEPVLEMNEDQLEEIDEVDDGDEIGVSNYENEQNPVDIEEEEEGDLKTMKEYIDIEMRKNRRNFWEAASVCSQKLRKWRLKQKEKKRSRGFNDGIDFNKSKLEQIGQFGQLGEFRDTQSEVADYGFGRRSCDTEARFSIDAHRLSIEDPRFSFDEHRASWDGYMIARTLPRLTPMMSLVDNMMSAPVNKVTNGNVNTNTNTNINTMIENLQMHSISEDGASSGGSGQSNSAGSSWSSMKSLRTKTVGLGCEDVKCASNARVSPANDVIFQGTKLVITEKELKDWHLNSIKNSNIESVSNASVSTSKTNVNVMNVPNGHKKLVQSRWKKVCNLWSNKKNVVEIPENRIGKGNSRVNVVRNPRIKRDEFVLDRNRSTRYSTSDIDSGLLRLYLTPFRSTRRGKSGKSRGPSMATNGLHLN